MNNRDLLIDEMKTNDIVLSNAIIHIYNNQTPTEQGMRTTSEDNGIGFNGTDAAFGSSLAQRILAGRQLTDAQKDGANGGGGARKMMKKYAGQLIATGFQWKEEEDVQADITRFDEACENLLGEGGVAILEILYHTLKQGNNVEYISDVTDIGTEEMNELYAKVREIQGK